MINTIAAKIFGTKNEREVKRLMPALEQMNGLDAATRALNDDQLRAKTDEFRKRIQERLHALPEGFTPEDEQAALKEVLLEIQPEAFAVVREAGRRVLNMRHFDVQFIGGMEIGRAHV